MLLTHAVLKFSLLVAKVIHLLHQITPQNEPAGPTPRYREGCGVRLLWPRHEGWKQRRAGKNSGCCHRHEDEITVRDRGALRESKVTEGRVCCGGFVEWSRGVIGLFPVSVSHRHRATAHGFQKEQGQTSLCAVACTQRIRQRR